MDLRIRQATVLDAPAMAAMKAAAWREAYTGVVPDDVLDRQGSDAAVASLAGFFHQQMSEGASYWLVIDHDADGEIVGLANAMPSRDVDAPTPLELVAIYLRERVTGTGVGEALLQYVIGDADCSLWVLEHNPRARAFYTKHGFVADGARQPVWEDLPEVVEIRMVRRGGDAG